MRTALAAVGLLGVSAALITSPTHGFSRDAASASRVFRGPGITLTYPSGVFVTNRPFDWITDPAQRFVLSSYPLPNDRPNAGGNYTPPPTGIVAELMEDVPPPNPDFQAPARPRQFTLPKLTDHLETFGARWGEIVFRDHGRSFYIFIGVGRRVSSAKTALLFRALDGLTISAAPPSVTGA